MTSGIVPQAGQTAGASVGHPADALGRGTSWSKTGTGIKIISPLALLSVPYSISLRPHASTHAFTLPEPCSRAQGSKQKPPPVPSHGGRPGPAGRHVSKPSIPADGRSPYLPECKKRPPSPHPWLLPSRTPTLIPSASISLLLLSPPWIACLEAPSKARRRW
ncbi:uncharacterized protein PSFLO_01324 [Pseudozyma flocculosa]|uniref:Uncharacterized protein n=1 Tax=Pseudozyma flocculosa TaxID=84751 RepID=A0A5C3EU21_9BASI|nr:uncharacterized protein PSFLO_01324 [Pseudozyma flocculosa]